MTTVLILVHLMVVIALVIVVLLQRSEGGALGIGGGGGGVMSARGAADTMTRTTGVLAAVFFATSIALGVLAQGNTRADNVLDAIEGQPAVVVPVDPDSPTGDDEGGILNELNSLTRQPAAPATPAAPAAPAAPTE